MKDICFNRIATVLGQERLDLVRQFDWQLDYLELAYTRLGVGETRISDEEICGWSQQSVGQRYGNGYSLKQKYDSMLGVVFK